ncbi:MAG TPA: hypothetical protein VF407_16855, partial [Polyangiaceae bacterium]
MTNTTKARCLGAIVLTLLGGVLSGCGHQVQDEHYDVVLDEDGVRTEGFIDFPGYWSGGGCVEDDEHTCSSDALSVGTVHDLPMITSAKIVLDSTTDVREYVITIGDVDGGKPAVTCWLEPRDIGHAVQCVDETADGVDTKASITLTPVT